MAIDAICLRLSLRQILNNSRQLLLQDFDALLNDRIGLQISYALDLKVESLRDSVKIKWLTLLRRFLPVSIFALWPRKVLAGLRNP
jgi:hypothetical protein